MKSLVIIFFINFLCFYCLADEINLKNGEQYKGTILKISDNIIFIRTEKNTRGVKNDEIDNIIFSKVDIIYLKSNERIAGKIIKVEENDVILLYAQGTRDISRSKIKRVNYNYKQE